MSIWTNFKNWLTYDDVHFDKNGISQPIRITEELANYDDYNSIIYNWNYLKNKYPDVISEIAFAIDYIARQTAQLDIDIYKDLNKNIKEANTNEFFYTWNVRPNMYQNAYNLKYTLISYLFYYGEAIVIKDSEKEIHVFSLPDYQKYKNETTGEMYFGITINNQIVYYRQSDIMCFHLFDIFNELSPIYFIWKDAKLLEHAKNSYYKNITNSEVQKALMFNEENDDLNEEEEQRIAANVTNLLNAKTSKALYVTNAVRVDSFSKQTNIDKLTPADKYLKSKIMNFLGIPDGLIGGDSNQGVDERLRLFYISTLSPLLSQIEIEIDAKWNKKSHYTKGGGVRFDTSKLFRLQENERINNSVARINANITTISEEREKLGFAPNKKLQKQTDNLKIMGSSPPNETTERGTNGTKNDKNN